MKIRFQKFEGAGNDFVVIDHRRGNIRHAPAVARRLCDRHRGVGADGLLLLERSNVADYRMMYYNADGSYGGMCGNGGRCIAMFAYLNRIAGRHQRFDALGHVYTAEIPRKGLVRLGMKDPVGLRAKISLKGPFGEFTASYVDTGSPHAVLQVRKGALRALELEKLGPWIRHHPAFRPKGTNVNFVERMGPMSLRMRTYERGVEAETQACGTGSVACSLVGAALQRMRSPVVVHTASGDRLKVSFDTAPSGYTNVILEGPVKRSFEGTIDV